MQTRRPSRWKLAAALAGVALVAFVGHEYLSLPDPSPLATRPPGPTALMLRRDAQAQAAGRKARRRQHWVALDAVAPSAVQAVLAAEDAGFWQHGGVDLDELRSAARASWDKKALGRGASTLTQQLAKNLYLGPERSLWRKLKELVLARRLERALGKKRILTLYLNVVEWGEGVYGLEAAAREHFGVSAAQLSAAQGAMLAAMLPAPRRWTPASRPQVLERRALRLVELLRERGQLSAAQASAAKEELSAWFGRTKSSPAPPPDPSDPGDEVDG